MNDTLIINGANSLIYAICIYDMEKEKVEQLNLVISQKEEEIKGLLNENEYLNKIKENKSLLSIEKCNNIVIKKEEETKKLNHLISETNEQINELKTILDGIIINDYHENEDPLESKENEITKTQDNSNNDSNKIKSEENGKFIFYIYPV